jgi:hypothetical protein
VCAGTGQLLLFVGLPLVGIGLLAWAVAMRVVTRSSTPGEGLGGELDGLGHVRQGHHWSAELSSSTVSTWQDQPAATTWSPRARAPVTGAT